MEKAFNLSIVSPEKTIYDAKAVSLVAPCALGYLGVLADHAPLAATLEKGKIIIREETGNTVTLESLGSGFLEVLNNNVTLILS